MPDQKKHKFPFGVLPSTIQSIQKKLCQAQQKETGKYLI
uniref:Uncharacterized protein n=1 Tax=Arundo donax TaxID=35708 RepID=A0A0A9F887_ARUDO